jgi:hypothetical protein
VVKPLEFKVNLSVIEHLGTGLYSKTPAVMTEIIANAWDADAENVRVTLAPEEDLIVVEDDGHGMTRDDVQQKFLNVGYRRRDHGGSRSIGKKRHVMGRKGIGKLAMFSLADDIEIVTKTRFGTAVACHIDVPDLKSKIQKVEKYIIKTPSTTTPLRSAHGTRITLRKLNPRINKDEEYLRRNLARRFSILGDLWRFRLDLNDKVVVRSDRDFYEDVQFLWCFDEETQQEVRPLMRSLASVAHRKGGRKDLVECVSRLPARFSIDRRAVTVTGYIASVDKPAKLGKGDESINMISVFANGRVFEEDVLADLGSARVFNSYVIGEVHADFLDRDDVDRATASREAIKRDDSQYQALRGHLRDCLKQVRDEWDKWRQALGYEKSADALPEIQGWIEGFDDARDRRLADRLMTSISNLSVADDAGKDRAAKMQLYRSTIVAFEKLKLRNRLAELEDVHDVTSPEFRAIFTSIDDVEESAFFDITRSRLDIIKKFNDQIIETKKLERVAQEYLFDHLWLLDPAWDRVSGSPEMEVTLTRELKRACPDAKGGARLDITYRTSAGRHVIVELKRPGRTDLSFDELHQQARKYRKAMTQYLKEHPDLYALRGQLPPMDIYLLVERAPQMDAEDEKALVAQSTKVLTYRGLIENARAAYSEYLKKKRVLGSLEKLLATLK